MKQKIIALVAVIALSGCANMSPEQKRTALIVGTVVVGAAVIASSSGGSDDNGNNCRIVAGPGNPGGTTVCN